MIRLVGWAALAVLASLGIVYIFVLIDKKPPKRIFLGFGKSDDDKKN